MRESVAPTIHQGGKVLMGAKGSSARALLSCGFHGDTSFFEQLKKHEIISNYLEMMLLIFHVSVLILTFESKIQFTLKSLYCMFYIL